MKEEKPQIYRFEENYFEYIKRIKNSNEQKKTGVNK
jgi:hypothetical protein